MLFRSPSADEQHQLASLGRLGNLLHRLVKANIRPDLVHAHSLLIGFAACIVSGVFASQSQYDRFQTNKFHRRCSATTALHRPLPAPDALAAHTYIHTYIHIHAPAAHAAAPQRVAAVVAVIAPDHRLFTADTFGFAGNRHSFKVVNRQAAGLVQSFFDHEFAAERRAARGVRQGVAVAQSRPSVTLKPGTKHVILQISPYFYKCIINIKTKKYK